MLLAVDPRLMARLSFGAVRDSLFLFDVDGTLLAAGSRHHNEALRLAVKNVCGRSPELDAIALAGRTDTEILRDMVVSVGGEDSPGVLARLFVAAIRDFETRCPADISGLVIQGVRPVLERLQEEGAALGLVTGNIEAIAWRKMAAAGLRGFFAFGAFGDESGRRADLPPLAVSRAGRSFVPSRTYVIGDTPLDIDCGAVCGLQTIAVATGRYSFDELRSCRPTLTCRNLVEFLTWLSG